VQTKVAPVQDPDEFLRAFDRSLDCLQLDCVDLFSLHGINNAEVLDWALRRNGCLAAARKLQAEGRVRFIGFSTHAPEPLITRAIESGEFDYVNLHWYFVNHFNWPAVLAACRHDMGVFIISPNDKGGMLYQPPPKLRKLCEPLSPMMFNDLYCLSRPEVHTLSIGAARPGDFDEHLAALEFYERAAEVIAPVERRLREEMAAVLGGDWCRSWWNGIPEYTETPGEINLLEILRLWSFAKSLDLVEFGKMRYNLLGNAGHWFPGKNAAQFVPDQIRTLLAGHPFAERIPVILAEAHELLKGEEKKRLSQSD
jgi:predicted aldo/keto reductase-like oxidoreductase